MSPFADWAGRSETQEAPAPTSTSVGAFKATFGSALAPGIDPPLGLHWCLFPSLVEEVELARDGHPEKGNFLPPVPLPRRMWAGGEIEFLAPIPPDRPITRLSRIESVTEKTGRSGPLVFVKVSHAYRGDSALFARETQEIVYREAATRPSPAPKPGGDPPAFEEEASFRVSEVTLFRYSALTFNAHRIHYDKTYTQTVEHYPDLVIHGPLQATLLMNFAAKSRGGRPSRFSYRGLAPATGSQTLKLGCAAFDDGLRLWLVTESGIASMQATAQW